MPKYGNSAPGPQKWNFSKFFHFCGKVSRFRFLRALNYLQTLSLSPVMQENGILAHYAQIWKFGPKLPKMEFFKKFHFFEKVSRFRFQRALNHPQTLSLSQVMQENVILAYYAQIWKFGSRLPKMEFLKTFIFLKRSSDFASNEPSTTCRHEV